MYLVLLKPISFHQFFIDVIAIFEMKGRCMIIELVVYNILVAYRREARVNSSRRERELVSILELLA